jgi:membrane protease YdiL (CAAX protease family)
MNENNHPTFHYSHGMVALYFVLTFAITWIFLIPAVSVAPQNLQTLLFIPAAFGPFLAAIIIILITKGRNELTRWLRQIFRLRIPLILYLSGAFFLPIGIGVMQYGLYRILGGSPDFSGATPWYQYLAYLLPTALLVGGNEEPGWRGFALPALLERFHPVLCAVILGIVHSLWHLPLMEQYGTTMGGYLFNLLPLTFIFNWFYLKSKFAVVPVMLFHAGTNIIGDFIPTPVAMLDGLATPIFLRACVYWVIAMVLLIATKGRLGHPSKTSENQ